MTTETASVETRIPRPFGVVTMSGKFVNQSLLDGYASKLTTDESTPSRALDTSDDFSGSYADKGLIAPPYNPALLASVLTLNTYHSRSVKTKARDTAGLGWQLTAKVDNPNEAQKKQIIERFEAFPEPLSATLNKCQIDLESIGYATLEVIWKDYTESNNAEALLNLRHLTAHTMRKHKDGLMWAQMRGTKTRWFKSITDSNGFPITDYLNADTGQFGPGVERDKRASTVISWNNYDPNSETYGLPDHIPAIGAIHGDVSRRDYNIAFFDNYGVPAYAVFITGDYNPGEEDEHGKTALQSEVERHFSQLNGKPHSTLVLALPTRSKEGEIKITFEKLAVDTTDASFRLYRMDNRDEVLAAHGMPAYRIGIVETGSLGGTTAEESTDIYKMSIVEPRQATIEDLINRYVLKPLGITDWYFELVEIDNTDEKHEMELCQALFTMQAMTPDEIREHWRSRFNLKGDVDKSAFEPDPATVAATVAKFLG